MSQEAVARKFDLEVPGSAKDLGELQYNVLTCVAERRFHDALEFLRRYKSQKGTYQLYIKRTEQLFKYAEDLISAIESKRNFPNLHALPQSKQEEIHQKTVENWEALKVAMRRLRSIERDLALQDARSSVWVLKAAIFCFLVVITLFIVNEAFRSFGQSFGTFLDETVKLIIDSFNSLF